MDIEVALAANATKYRTHCKGIFYVGAHARAPRSFVTGT